MKKGHLTCTLKILKDLCFKKTKNKNKKYFFKSCLQCFSSKHVLTENKEVRLSLNGAQSVGLEKGTIKFKSYLKQIAVPFIIYADFECNEGLRVMKVLTQKSIDITFLVVLLTSLFVLLINLVNRLLFLEAKILLMNLLKQFLKSIRIVRK